MPYADREKQRDFQRRRVAHTRAEYLRGKACVDCGSVERLELDHVDPGSKVSHRLWSWAPTRRALELAKCVVRCRSCHSKRHHPRQDHGLGAYKRGCRCDECRAAKAASARHYYTKVAA